MTSKCLESSFDSSLSLTSGAAISPLLMPPLIQAKLLPETSKYRAISTPLPLSQASRCNPTLPRRDTESNSAKRQTVVDRVSEYSTSHTTGSPRVHSSYIPRTQFLFSPPSSLRQDDKVEAVQRVESWLIKAFALMNFFVFRGANVGAWVSEIGW
ncbi:hypothetical protein COLO4_08849 [Corchorus olitorius]|uniref:Uncharacterized protein n=1 Tax=Corchorus olitorius TaxID=93759 RepID=A0A1R3KEE1_9ROSI|nr:hypothetical protein COLO4_08849 [Corchorus olitorius]